MIKANAGKVQVESLPPGYVINPVSGRLISVKSRQYQQLLNNNVLDVNSNPEPVKVKQTFKPKTVVADCTSKHKALIKKHELQESNPAPQNKIYALTSSGNKVVLRNKKSKSMKPDQMADIMSQAFANVQKKLQNEYDSEEEIDMQQKDYFKSLILQEIANIKSKNNRRIAKKTVQESETESDQTESSYDEE